MVCKNIGKITKKKIVVLSSVASGIAAATYAAFTLTHNPAIAGTVPALLSFAACPAMCVGMGGAFWLVRRFSHNSGNKGRIHRSKEEETSISCCSTHEMSGSLKPLESKNEDDIDVRSRYVETQKREFEN